MFINIKKILITPTLIFSLVLTLFYNFCFFKNILGVYPFGKYFVDVICVSIVLFHVIFIILQFIYFKHVFKMCLIILFLIAMLSSFSMDTFGVPVDKTMIQNLFLTDMKETTDLMSMTFIIRFLFLFLMPAFFILKSKFYFGDFKQQVFMNLTRVGFCLIVITSIGLIKSKFFASFLREHKSLRYYSNPAYPLFSGINFFVKRTKQDDKMIVIGEDAKILETDKDRDLVIMVLGETARTDRFSLNGYSKKTNPYLEKEKVFSFRNFYSCGTSTAESLPCLFSNLGINHYDRNLALHTFNILDVLVGTHDIKVLWRDNNSDSKGVANRVIYEDFKEFQSNPVCDEECRDIGMLSGLQKIIDKTKEKDLLIVLHQMGSHGPAYFKRYPKEFEQFKPVCKTAELSDCTNEEINNAYDNTILYTDFFLKNVIDLLKKNSNKFETGMIYISDHGESLGENGIYLHSLPRFFAPEEQIKVPAIFWFGEKMRDEINLIKLNNSLNSELNHEAIFHTLLGLFEVQTKFYNPKLDLLH